MLPLTRQRRLVEHKALVVQRDREVLEAARRRLISRFTGEITGPVALVTLFAAGLAVGAYRRGAAPSQAAQGGRFSRAALAGLSMTRLLRIARMVDATMRG